MARPDRDNMIKLVKREHECMVQDTIPQPKGKCPITFTGTKNKNWMILIGQD